MELKSETMLMYCLYCQSFGLYIHKAKTSAFGVGLIMSDSPTLIKLNVLWVDLPQLACLQ